MDGKPVYPIDLIAERDKKQKIRNSVIKSWNANYMANQAFVPNNTKETDFVPGNSNAAGQMPAKKTQARKAPARQRPERNKFAQPLYGIVDAPIEETVDRDLGRSPEIEASYRNANEDYARLEAEIAAKEAAKAADKAGENE